MFGSFICANEEENNLKLTIIEGMEEHLTIDLRNVVVTRNVDPMEIIVGRIEGEIEIIDRL